MRNQTWRCRCDAHCGTVITVDKDGRAWFQSVTTEKEEIVTFSWLWVNNRWSISDAGLKFLRKHVPLLEGKWYVGKPVRVQGEPGVRFTVLEFLGDRVLVRAELDMPIKPTSIVLLTDVEEA